MPGQLLQYVRVGSQGKVMRTQTLGIRLFGGGRAQHRHFCAEGCSDLYTHMSQSSQTENADFVPFAHVPVAQG